MTMDVGEQVPDLAVAAFVRGVDEPVELRLSEYRGRWLVVFFYPRDFTFVCPTELVAFAELEADFGTVGAVVVGASTDSYWTHRAWFTTDPRLGTVSYPVVADANQALASAFGVLGHDGAAYRATFLVDPDGVVRHASVTTGDAGRNVDEVLRTLQAVQTGALCPAGWRPGEPTLVAS